jgi:hypothetical protein
MKLIFVGLFLLIGSVVLGQDVKAIYAYKHIVPMGNIPVIPKERVEPNGNNQPQEDFNKPRWEYFIFVETTNGKAPEITKLMVDGVTYTFTAQKVTVFPQEYEYYNGSKQGKIVMLDSKKKNIYKLELNADTKVLAANTNKNKVSIQYKFGKIIMLKVLSKIIDMPSSVVP